jgi:hypothetical protein
MEEQKKRLTAYLRDRDQHREEKKNKLTTKARRTSSRPPSSAPVSPAIPHNDGLPQAEKMDLELTSIFANLTGIMTTHVDKLIHESQIQCLEDLISFLKPCTELDDPNTIPEQVHTAHWPSRGGGSSLGMPQVTRVPVR